MMRPRETVYSDELLADGSVHRSYDDGRQEWRRRDPSVAGLVRWHDNMSASGTDELLGDRIVKRVSNGTVSYGRDIGYGRTVWGRDFLTVNRTSFGGRMGLLLAGVGVTALAVTEAQLPPLSLSPEEEEELRRQAEASARDGGEGGGSGDSGGGFENSGDDWDGDWGDGDDGGWSDDDFG
ncbi:hypothetical protein [Streptomyces sp. NPDC060198]|uniref:hypothetical protein n=1 Tax=Streptomyces sp. NPDC060198 TaxID=3347070 RepID=UPI003660C855